MSSEIEMISPIGEKEDIEPLSSEKLFRIRKYLLILVTIQWVGSCFFYFEKINDKNVYLDCMYY